MEKILGLAIARVLKWGSFLCGFIPERIETPVKFFYFLFLNLN